MRNFQVGFNNHGVFSEYGKGDVNRLFKEALKCDKLQSRISNFSYKNINFQGEKKEKKKYKKKSKKRNQNQSPLK